MKRDYEEMRDEAIAKIANRLYDAERAQMDQPSGDDLACAWIDCETAAVKQVEQIEKRREEESIEARALRWLFDRGVLA